MQERRSAPRIPERLSVMLADQGQEFLVETKNLSASGAYCTVDRFIPPMTKLSVRYALPNGPHPMEIHCSGVVVRTEPTIAHADRAGYHIAIFFTDVSDRDQAAIQQFVQRLLPSPAAVRSDP